MKLSILRNLAAVRIGVVALAAALSAALLVGADASASPSKPSAITAVTKAGRTWHLTVYSAAMNKEVAVEVQRPADESRPVLYPQGLVEEPAQPGVAQTDPGRAADGRLVAADELGGRVLVARAHPPDQIAERPVRRHGCEPRRPGSTDPKDMPQIVLTLYPAHRCSHQLSPEAPRIISGAFVRPSRRS